MPLANAPCNEIDNGHWSHCLLKPCVRLDGDSGEKLWGGGFVHSISLPTPRPSRGKAVLYVPLGKGDANLPYHWQKESLAAQREREESASKIGEYEARIESMQKHIREITERSSRMRTMYER